MDDFFFLSWRSGITWNLRFRLQVSSISGPSGKKNKFVRSFLEEVFFRQFCFWDLLTFSSAALFLSNSWVFWKNQLRQLRRVETIKEPAMVSFFKNVTPNLEDQKFKIQSKVKLCQTFVNWISSTQLTTKTS